MWLPLPQNRRALWGAVVLVLCSAAFSWWAYVTVPTGNTDATHFDALLVMGSPTDTDGTLRRPQRWRVDEAMREYRAGRAEHVICTGGPAANEYVEARTMGEYALQCGLPKDALLEETDAKNTIHNISYSYAILAAHGWTSVEIVTAGDHAPRVAEIVRREAKKNGWSHLQWRMHVAPTPGRSLASRITGYMEEAASTAAIRVFGLKAGVIVHAVAWVQGKVFTALRRVRQKM
jgi:uncharacterized SAM-binding protein YcdF (DUF218 family)